MDVHWESLVAELHRIVSNWLFQWYTISLRRFTGGPQCGWLGRVDVVGATGELRGLPHPLGGPSQMLERAGQRWAEVELGRKLLEDIRPGAERCFKSTKSLLEALVA